MQHDVTVFLFALEYDPLSIDRDDVAVGVDRVAQLGGMPVDSDPSVSDRLFRLAAGHDAMIRKYLLNPDAFSLCHKFYLSFHGSRR